MAHEHKSEHKVETPKRTIHLGRETNVRRQPHMRIVAGCQKLSITAFIVGLCRRPTIVCR